MRPRTKYTWLIFLLLSIHFHVAAQRYRIQTETTQIKLYMGYINPISLPYIFTKDTVNRITIHATAAGAEIDYDSLGHMQIIPYQKFGSIDIYVELAGRFYYAGKINFEGVKPPPTDGSFRAAMGITEDNPQNKLKNKRNFNIRGRPIIRSNEVTLGGFRLNNLDAGRLNILVVTGIYLVDTLKTNPYVVQQGSLEILSSDAQIRKMADNKFGVIPLAGKGGCKVHFFLDGRKIHDETWSVY